MPDICFDRIIPERLREVAKNVAVKENPKNHPDVISDAFSSLRNENIDPRWLIVKDLDPDSDLKLKFDKIGIIEPDPEAISKSLSEKLDEMKMLMAVPENSMWVPSVRLPWGTLWSNDRVLKVKFLGGTPEQQKKIRDIVVQWQEYANIRFRFIERGNAEIRITFDSKLGSWSAVGTDCLIVEDYPLDQATMNLGWVDDAHSEDEIDGTILHEFGHALGCVHEHSSPASPLKWNRMKVIKYYSAPPNCWSRKYIIDNIFYKYGKEILNFTTFDPDSIMLYDFPAELFLDAHGTKANNTLSELDKHYIKLMYPF